MGIEEIIIFKGSFIFMICIIYGILVFSMVWFRDSQFLGFDVYLIVSIYGMVLQFFKVEIEDLGKYICIVLNEVGEVSKYFIFKVLELFYINGFEEYEEILVIVNNLFEFVCIVFGILVFKMIWMKDGWFFL